MNGGGESVRVVPTNRRRTARFAVFAALICLGVLALLPLAGSGMAAEPAGKADLKKAIVTKMLGQKEGRAFSYSTAEETQNTQANVKRISADGNWAFGTAVIEAPKKKGAYPEARLFVAEKADGAWDVALEGSSGFPELSNEAPTSVVDEGEKDLFAASDGSSNERSAYASVDTGLRLPWKRGTRWTMTGGPHGWSTGYDRPYSSLDFAGGDSKVRAARGGRVYTMCGNEQGYIRVYHRNGYATDYYHLRGNIKPRDGKRIKGGTFLGYTGTDVSCGGSATGSHVHFSVLRNGARTALDNKTLGGWTFQEGSAYNGYAQHSGTRRYPGDLLRNFGSN